MEIYDYCEGRLFVKGKPPYPDIVSLFRDAARIRNRFEALVGGLSLKNWVILLQRRKGNNGPTIEHKLLRSETDRQSFKSHRSTVRTTVCLAK